jgi:hypothetical protein
VGETAHAFGCLAKLGKNGCGLEQQLEAGLKALTPASSKLLFFMGSHGQGGDEGPNAGFLREDIDALLARDDMQFRVERNPAGTADQPVPTCGGADGTAAPGRRFLALSKEFGENGVVASICASDYSAVIGVLSTKIGTLLRGEVLLD